MTTSTDTVQPGQQSAASGNKKPLWAAIGILGMTVVAMGGTLLYKQRAPAPPVTVAAITATTSAPPQYPTARQTTTPAASANLADDLIEKSPAAPVKSVPLPLIAAPAHAAAPAPGPASVQHVQAPAPSAQYSGASPAYAQPNYVATAPVCAVCGSVESVTPVERSAKPDGVGIGTVAGGVLGAVLGNQVGHGNGRAAATVLGAVGGGFAGNAIEGKMRRETVYQVGVRMQDGSRRTVEVALPPVVGSAVTVDGATLRTRDDAALPARDGASHQPRRHRVHHANTQPPGMADYPTN
ncbi:MAG: 17 kDa surface antigen [Polaromonas sp.]|nr:17 kDa surface antigen [Polaromonas sp.]